MPERVWLTPAEHNGVAVPGVWLALGPVELPPGYHQIGERADIAYVPESALLAAEARVREVEAERDAIGGEVGAGLYSGALHLLICNGDHNLPLWDVKPGVLCNCPIGKHFKELHRENATLRAERNALVPLARFAMRVHDTGDNTADAAVADGVLVWVRDSECDESPAFTQARSILAREAGE